MTSVKKKTFHSPFYTKVNSDIFVRKQRKREKKCDNSNNINNINGSDNDINKLNKFIKGVYSNINITPHS